MFLELTIVLEVTFYQLRKKSIVNILSNIMGFGSPTVQGRQGIALQEAYDLTGENFYNPYWGYQTQRMELRKKKCKK